MTNNIVNQLRDQALGMVGSFWAQTSADTQQRMLALSVLAGGSEAISRPVEDVDHLLGTRWSAVGGITLPFMEGDSAYIGPDLSRYTVTENGDLFVVRRPASAGAAVVFTGLMAGEGVSAFPFPSVADLEADGSFPLYLVPTPDDLFPRVILAKDGLRALVSGIDFTAHQGFIALRENPGDVFDGAIHVVSAIRRVSAPYSYTLQVDATPHGNDRVVSYFRRSRSLSCYQMAIAQAAGMWVLRHDDTVLARYDLLDRVRYVMAAEGVVDVQYTHRQLSAGSTYPAGTVVAARFRIISSHSEPWAGRLGEGSIELDTALPVRGISYTTGASVLADFEQSSAAGHPHVRLHLAGEPEDLSALWEWQRLHELDTGNFLSAALGITSTAPAKLVDFESFLATYYGKSLLIIDISGLSPAQEKVVRYFAMREKPTGAVILFFKSTEEFEFPYEAFRVVFTGSQQVHLDADLLTIPA